MLAVGELAQVIILRETTIAYPDSVPSLSATKVISKTRTVWYYFGSMLYSKLTILRHITNTLGRRLMEINIKAFMKLSKELHLKFTAKTKNEDDI